MFRGGIAKVFLVHRVGCALGVQSKHAAGIRAADLVAPRPAPTALPLAPSIPSLTAIGILPPEAHGSDRDTRPDHPNKNPDYA